MSLLLYSDIIKIDNVRNGIEDELKAHSEKQFYSFKSIPETLYKFCDFKNYVINNEFPRKLFCANLVIAGQARNDRQ